MTYTLDFKRKALARLTNGARLCDVSRAAGVPTATVLRWRRELLAEREARVQAARIEAQLS